MLLAAIVAGGLYWRSHRAPKLTEQDTLVLADFNNTTGDPVFDDTLKQAISVQLGQSPFLNILSDARMRGTLKLMAKPSDTKLTPEVARELCQRAKEPAISRAHRESGQSVCHRSRCRQLQDRRSPGAGTSDGGKQRTGSKGLGRGRDQAQGNSVNR